MFALRQTWGDVFPPPKLYTLDVKVNQIDPHWPISAQKISPAIHVNPNFFSSTVSSFIIFVINEINFQLNDSFQNHLVGKGSTDWAPDKATWIAWIEKEKIRIGISCYTKSITARCFNRCAASHYSCSKTYSANDANYAKTTNTWLFTCVFGRLNILLCYFRIFLNRFLLFVYKTNRFFCIFFTIEC